MRQNFRVSCFFLGREGEGGGVPATFGIAWPRLVLAPRSQIIVIANDDVDKFRKYPRHRVPKSQHAIRRAPIVAVGKWRETLKEAFTRLTNALSLSHFLSRGKLSFGRRLSLSPLNWIYRTSPRICRRNNSARKRGCSHLRDNSYMECEFYVL